MACKFIDVSVMLTLVCSKCGENVEGELKRFRGESELKIEPCKHCIEAAAREQLETAVAA